MLLQVLDTLLLLLYISTYKHYDRYSNIFTSQLISQIHFKNCRTKITSAGRSGRAVKGVGLRPLAC